MSYLKIQSVIYHIKIMLECRDGKKIHQETVTENWLNGKIEV